METSTEPTMKQVLLIPDVPPVEFAHYPGPSSNIPVLDIGDLFGKALSGILGNKSIVESHVLGDTGAAFTVCLTRNEGHVLMLTFGPMSFATPPGDLPEAHRAHYNRYHLVVMDFNTLRQLTVPFSTPADLAYSHERGMWGLRQDGHVDWAADAEDVYAIVAQLVEPVISWIRVVKPNF